MGTGHPDVVGVPTGPFNGPFRARVSYHTRLTVLPPYVVGGYTSRCLPMHRLILPALLGYTRKLFPRCGTRYLGLLLATRARHHHDGVCSTAPPLPASQGYLLRCYAVPAGSAFSPRMRVDSLIGVLPNFALRLHVLRRTCLGAHRRASLAIARVSASHARISATCFAGVIATRNAAARRRRGKRRLGTGLSHQDGIYFCCGCPHQKLLPGAPGPLSRCAGTGGNRHTRPSG